MHAVATIPRNSGFTLIELLFTIAVAAIVVSLAATGLREIVAKNQMSTAVNTMLANLQLARSEAVTRGESITLCPDKTSTTALDCADSADPNIWHTGYFLFVDPDRDGYDAGEEVIRHVQGNANAAITVTTTSGRPRVTFDEEGTSGGANATFTFCDTMEIADPREVSLSPVGRARSDAGGDCGY